MPTTAPPAMTTAPSSTTATPCGGNASTNKRRPLKNLVLLCFSLCFLNPVTPTTPTPQNMKTLLLSQNAELNSTLATAATLLSELESLQSLSKSLQKRTALLNLDIESRNANQILNLTTRLVDAASLRESRERLDIVTTSELHAALDYTERASSIQSTEAETELEEYVSSLAKTRIASLLPDEGDAGIPADRATCISKSQGLEMAIDGLHRYDADGVGMRDACRENCDVAYVGDIRGTSDTYTPEGWRVDSWMWHSLGLKGPVPSPEQILDVNTSPGHCWPMEGRSGRVTLRFSSDISFWGISIDHNHHGEGKKELSSAPRFWNVLDGTSGEVILRGEYNLDGNDVQSFLLEEDGSDKCSPVGEEEEEDNSWTIPKKEEEETGAGSCTAGTEEEPPSCSAPPLEETDVINNNSCGSVAPSPVISSLTFVVDENWGREDYTCIYRLRVHGEVVA